MVSISGHEPSLATVSFRAGDAYDRDQLRAALAEFVGVFEIVFRYDRGYTKVMIGD